MRFFETLLQSDIAQALGWTLVHAIWQVAAIALVLMVVLFILRKSPARVRYQISLSAMAAVVVLSMITFVVSYRYLSGGNQESLPAEVIVYSAASVEANGFFPGIAAFFYRNLFTLVALWAMGVVLLSLRFAGSMWYLHRLRSRAVVASDKWARKLGVMAEQSGIDRAVRLAESAMVRMPVLIGHLKPLILVPAGMLAAIPSEQVEAILAHELGHIRRNDFLVNLLQSVAEIVYFFHPGIWWISTVIRRERELCCDDMAMEQGCDPVTLAFALSEVGEWVHSDNPRNGNLTLAFSGRGEQPLLTRIKRLLGQEPSSPLSMLPAAALVTTLVLFLLLAGSDRVFSSTDDPDKEFLNKSGYGFTQDTTGTDTLPASRRGNVVIKRGMEVGVEADTSPAPDLELPPVPPAPVMDLSEMPKLNIAPVPAPAPSPAPVPAMPAPPVVDSVTWEQFGLDMKDFGLAMAWAEQFVSGSDTTKLPDFQFNFDEESMKDFEKSMEDFGKQMEEWGKEYGKKMEAWAKANEPKMKEFELKMKEWEKENKPKLEEYERKMEKWQKENAPKMKEFELEMKEWQKENKPRIEEYQRKMEEYQHKMEQWQKDTTSRQQEYEKG